jgi:hypothetical protein
MGWEIGWDSNHKRDIGYGVPAYCDHPGCKNEIDRGLGFLCGDGFGERGCGLFFCAEHLFYTVFRERLCKRCLAGKPAFIPKPDHPKWTKHKETDPSWSEWRKQQARIKAEEIKSKKNKNV